MSQFNKATKVQLATSKNGNLQYAKSVKQQAYELVVNSMYGRDTFYESSDAKVVRFRNILSYIVNNGELDFIANLLVFARNEMNMRNMPIMGLSIFIDELRKQHKTFKYIRKLVPEIVKRVDQITDMLALLSSKTKMPMALKRGLSDAFNNFDEYQFAKYNRKGKVTLKDALRIIHPIPKDEDQSCLYQKIMADELATPDTWEVELSAKGNTKEVWEGLIDRKVLGYQATLKNLRNMLVVSDMHKRKVAEYITSKALTSKSLPFEYLAAIKAVENAGCQIFNTALIKAMDLTVANVPVLGTKVLVMLDTSGSMTFGTSGTQSAAELSCFLTAVLAKSSSESSSTFDVINFASSANWQNINTYDSVYSIYQKLLSKVGGGSTNFEAALQLGSTREYDTVFCLTDNEINRFNYMSSGYAENFQKGAERYVINCASSVSSPLPPHSGWGALAGWSTNMFKYIEAMRNGESMVERLSKPFVPKPIRCNIVQAEFAVEQGRVKLADLKNLCKKEYPRYDYIPGNYTYFKYA